MIKTKCAICDKEIINPKMMNQYTCSKECKELYKKIYQLSDEYKKHRKEYMDKIRETEHYKEYIKAYQSTPQYKAYQRTYLNQYHRTDKWHAYMKKWKAQQKQKQLEMNASV